MKVNIKKEDFQLVSYDDINYSYYTTLKNNIDIIIEIDYFNENGIKYAEFILNQYLQNKDNVIEHVLQERLLKFYKERYSEEYIKNNLNNPQIRVLDYDFATITWLNHNLDEHIIELEIDKNFILGSVILSG